MTKPLLSCNIYIERERSNPSWNPTLNWNYVMDDPFLLMFLSVFPINLEVVLFASWRLRGILWDTRHHYRWWDAVDLKDISVGGRQQREDRFQSSSWKIMGDDDRWRCRWRWIWNFDELASMYALTKTTPPPIQLGCILRIVASVCVCVCLLSVYASNVSECALLALLWEKEAGTQRV